MSYMIKPDCFTMPSELISHILINYSLIIDKCFHLSPRRTRTVTDLTKRRFIIYTSQRLFRPKKELQLSILSTEFIITLIRLVRGCIPVQGPIGTYCFTYTKNKI